MIPTTVAEAARRFGDRIAYVTELGWSLTHADIDRISDEVAAGLRREGVTEGDVVAMVLPPGPEYLLAYCAAAKVGAITAGVNDRLSPRERSAVLDVAAPKLTLTDASTLLVDLRVTDATPPPLADDPDRPVAIIFTSGTTGLPKGALYCNRQLAFITQTDTGGAWDAGGRTLSGTSFAHLGFMTKLPGSLQRGGTTFIMERWHAAEALELLAREKMTTVAGVPTQLALMLRHPDFDSFDLSSVRFIIAGGGPVTPGLADEARRRFGAALATRYSCTEAGIGLGTAFDDPEEDAVVSVGRPHASVELSLVDGDDRPVPAGDVGEVCLRSPAVMSEYWRDPEQTLAAFTADGFVRTGDLGWIDDRGRLRLVGRSKEMYVRGGYNVYPVEVESVLSKHPDIAAIAIVPRGDDVMGEIGVAVVVPRDPSRVPTLDELRAFAGTEVAAYKLPEAVAIRADLPLTAMEKIDRRALVAELNDLVTQAPMELEFTADQDELRASIHAVLTRESPVSLARAVAESDARPTALWATMVELGWPALTIAEEHGGIGLGMLEAAILAEELGRVIAPGPLLSTVSQYVPAVREAGTPEQQAHLLGHVAAGELTGTLAIAERSGSFDPADVAATITFDGEHAVLSGAKRFVMEGDAVDEAVVVARVDGQPGDDAGVRAVAVPVSAVATEKLDAFDGSRRLVHIDLDGVRVERDAVLGDPDASAAPALRRALEEATVCLTLEMVGTAQAIFDITLEYAKHREQFGVPIGSFQATKHKFADMMIALERARSLGYFAALTIAEDDERRTSATSVAKAAAGDCQRMLAKEGIQIHGGIGYTWEHDMHLYVRRMKSGEPLFGSGGWHRARVADLLGV